MPTRKIVKILKIKGLINKEATQNVGQVVLKGKEIDIVYSL